MKLNAYILQDELAVHHKIDCFGCSSTLFHLGRPELYNATSDTVPVTRAIQTAQKKPALDNGRTFCLTCDCLTSSPSIGINDLLICVGPNLPEQYRQGDVNCIWIDEPVTCFANIFNEVQEIYNTYDEWENCLQSILMDTSNVQEIVNCSERIFQNPIIVIDASLRFLGYSDVINSDPRLEAYRQGADGKVHTHNLQEYLLFRDTYTKSGPLFNSSESVCTADIWGADKYLGNITIIYTNTKPRKSDSMLLKFLEHYLSNALTKYINNPDLRNNVLRQAFQGLLDGTAINDDALRLLEENTDPYVCVVLKFLHHTEYAQPVSCYCSYIENALPDSIGFARKSTIVIYARINPDSNSSEFFSALNNLVNEMNLYAGISNTYYDVSCSHHYYRQAVYAIQCGKHLADQQKLFSFDAYAHRFLLENSVGGMPIEAFYTSGLLKLFKHDENSKVSFSDTLLLYLRNDMNITNTALDLNIHRSSFLERLRNIETLLSSTLDDPLERFYLQLILEYRNIKKGHTSR